jgi:hypothetical protein
MPASLRMSSVGRVTKPAPSMSTFLEAGSTCQLSRCLEGHLEGAPWGVPVMAGCVVGCWGNAGLVYCCEAILDRICDCVTVRRGNFKNLREILALAWQKSVKQRRLNFVFAVCCRLTSSPFSVPLPLCSGNGPIFSMLFGQPISRRGMAGYAVATLRRVPATSISRSFVRANPPFSRAQHSIPRSHSQLVLLALKWDSPLGDMCVCG